MSGPAPDRAGDAGPDAPAATIVALCAALTVVGGVAGFALRPDGGAGDLWDTICRAVGIATIEPAMRPAAAVASRVSWTAAAVSRSRGGDPARGAFVGGNCTACHGTPAAQRRSGAPGLAELGRESVYKEMLDYRDGRRTSPVMQAISASLSDADIADVAAWAETQPRSRRARGPADPRAMRLISVGDPARGIGACAACHGPAGIVPGAPSLDGLVREYFTQQMHAFARGERRNDLNQQMRIVARPLRDAEISGLADYYAAPRGGER